jgi:hypothetical protein
MRTFLSAFLGAFALAGCASSGATTSTTTAGSAASASKASPTLVATLNPTNAVGNRVMGNVRLTPTANGYRAEISIRNGGGPQNKFPWVIRRGACGETSSDILGSELAYRLLETIADGTARINAPLALQVPPTGIHHVDVLSGTDPEKRQVVISCGVLSPA